VIRTTGAIRTTATTFLIVVLALALAGTAQAEVTSRLADLESRTSSPYEFDQVSKHCSTSTVSRDTSRAYTGSASLKVHTQDDPACEGPYARGIFKANGTRHLVEGDDFWFGAAIYLPSGFYAAHDHYTDLLRVDSYVYDNSSDVPFAERAEINFASWSNDSLYVRAARGGTARTLVGPISPTALPEGQWNWVEVHVKLSTAGGTAYTELKINGNSIGSSRTANLFAGAAPLNRLRYGIVSTDSEGSGNLTAYFDRASLSSTERGPIQPAPEEPPTPETGPTPSRVSFWRLDERSGTTAADATGAAPGTYVNDPILGVPGIAAGGVGTAVSFDGVDDYVAINPVPALDLTNAITIEAWCRVDAFAGSVLQRFEAYELRPQLNGSLAWRIWVNGALNMVVSKAETVSLGQVHQLVGTYDGSTMTLYLDGAPLGSRAVSGPMTHGTPLLDIGRNGHANTYFDGEIDDVSIYSGALSAATVLERFQRGPD
jgi:hypothetical protein